MFDFGNIGNGSVNSTFLFDDIEQVFGGTQIDLPVHFEDTTVNYTITDFGGNVSALVPEPGNPDNTVMQVIKTTATAIWAGTTIGTPAGFKTNIPLTLSDSKMTVKVWSPEAGTPIRLEVEDSDDPTHTCETQTNTTLGGTWEHLEFDFLHQVPGTELLIVGLSKGRAYNMAALFFNFGTTGAHAGEKIYYFDEVKFGGLALGTNDPTLEGISVFPNPTYDQWTITTDKADITWIELYDLRGNRILLLQSKGKTERLDASGLPGGIYVLKITPGSERVVLGF
jgi:hypothetical protein